jgi:glutamyl-Q tRNA(Asp) synthetase
MPEPPVLRFAPSPNGPLHLGHALSALTGFEMARRLGGRFLLRIEDIDIVRSREEYVAAILEDLAWLGIAWEEPVLRQSQRFGVYAQAAQMLEAQGLLYPCFATRTEIAAAAVGDAVDPEGTPLYPGLHKCQSQGEIEKRIGAGERYALRLHVDRALEAAKRRLDGRPLTFTELDGNGSPRVVAAAPERWGDTVILRKDVPASYHLAVVVEMRCKASPTSCAAAISTASPISSACCRSFWAFQCPFTIITGWLTTIRAASSRRAPGTQR